MPEPNAPKPSEALDSLRQVCAYLASANGKPGGRQLAGEASPLTRNLLFTIHRQQLAMDWLLNRLASGKIRPRLRHILHWAMAEHYWLTALPAPVITDVAVNYAKRQGAPSEGGFVNAVLRRLWTEIPDVAELERELQSAPPNIRLRLPETIYSRWKRQRDDKTIAQMAAAFLLPPQTVFRLRALAPQDTDLTGLQELPALPWTVGQRLFHPLSSADEARLLKTLEQGGRPAFYVQDPSTLLAPHLLDAQPGESLADLCSAPGGKSLLLAEALHGTGKLLCADRSAPRLARVRQNLQGYPEVQIVQADVTVARGIPLAVASQDGVLLDVPCSNTGVIRRAPDVRAHFSASGLAELVRLQGDILRGAAGLVRPGGRLVYSTCSVEPEENQLQIQAFLQDRPEFTLDCEQQILPCPAHDGAYAARLVRT